MTYVEWPRNRNLGIVPTAPIVIIGAGIGGLAAGVLLAARERGLGGVLTTFLSRAEPRAAPLLRLPDGHALAATIFIGHPVHQPTRLRRNDVAAFASIDTFDGPPLQVGVGPDRPVI